MNTSFKSLFTKVLFSNIVGKTLDYYFMRKRKIRFIILYSSLPHYLSAKINLNESYPHNERITDAENSCHFVKINQQENDNFALALRKRLFCNAKEPLLPCKTYTFGTQNNRFCNTLITR